MARTRISSYSHKGHYAPVELKIANDIFGCGVLHVCAKVGTFTPKMQHCNNHRQDYPRTATA